MTLFYTGSVLLLVLAFGFVVWPLIRQRINQTSKENELESRQQTNIDLYRDHLADLDQSLAAGSISQQQHDELKLELERNLLEDSHLVANAESSLSQRASHWLFVGIVGFIVLFGGIVYQQLGSYEPWQIKSVVEQKTQLENQYLLSADPSLEPQITAINQQLASRLDTYLQSKPDELEMRILLARTLITLGDFPKAISHFQIVLTQQPDLSQIMAEMAQAVFLQANNRVVPIVQSLVDRALQIEPDNTIALGLAGIASYQASQYQQAINFWQKAISLHDKDSANSKALQSGITAARQRLAELGSSQLDVEDTSVPEPSAIDGEVKIKLQVSMIDDINASPNDVVFIYARAWQGAKLPLAITRIKAADLPLDVTLTDAMAMAPGMNLSSAQALELVARLSKSGDPVPKPGDWQVTLGPVDKADVADQTYQLVISEQIP